MKKVVGLIGIFGAIALAYAAEPESSAPQSASVAVAQGPNLTLEVGQTAEILHKLSEDEAKASAQLRLAKIRSELEIMGVADEGGSGGGSGRASSARKPTGAPELVGISGRIGNLRAEFVVGSAIVRVGPGDSVTDRVRVISVDGDGVLVESDGSRQRLFFGRAAPTPPVISRIPQNQNPGVMNFPGLPEPPIQSN